MPRTKAHNLYYANGTGQNKIQAVFTVCEVEVDKMKEIVLTGYLVVLSVFDGRERKVPIGLLGVGTLLAVVLVARDCLDHTQHWQKLVLAAVLGLIPGVFMLLAAYITRKVGYGDGLALLAVGMLVGYKNCWGMLCISLMIMSFWCIGILLLRRGTKNTRLPYLPFLTAAYLMGLFVRGG